MMNTAILLVCMIVFCSCQGQPRTVLGGPSDTTIVPPPAEVLRNLIQDTVAISSLTDDDRAVLALRYNDNSAISSYTVIRQNIELKHC